MNILITTGGTGGHIFPALALAKEIQEKDSSAQIFFVGANYGMERELCEKANIPFVGLEVRGFVGRGLKSISAFFALVKAYFQAKKIINTHKIQKIIGFGGYASAPCMLAGISLKKEMYLHEQNAFPGAANRYFAKYAKRVFLSVPVEEGLFDKEIQSKCFLVGNPVRQDIARFAFLPQCENQGKRLLVLGGSLGAKSINSLVISLLEDLHKAGIAITHQCGKADYPRVAEAYKNSPYPLSCVQAFIEDMPKVYSEADIVIARAGASTLGELACMGKPAILIPFPMAAHNHQYYNGKALAVKKACVLLEEKDMYANNQVINKEILLQSILLLAGNTEEREELCRNIHGFAMPDATEKMYSLLAD